MMSRPQPVFLPGVIADALTNAAPFLSRRENDERERRTISLIALNLLDPNLIMLAVVVILIIAVLAWL
jgi:hypothetical protein